MKKKCEFHIKEIWVLVQKISQNWLFAIFKILIFGTKILKCQKTKFCQNSIFIQKFVNFLSLFSKSWFLARKFKYFQGWKTLKFINFWRKISNMSKSKALSKLIFFLEFFDKNSTCRVVCSFCVAVFLNFFFSFCCFVKWLKFCN